MKNQFISKLITFSRKIKYCSPANLIFEKNYSPNYLLRTLTEMIIAALPVVFYRHVESL